MVTDCVLQIAVLISAPSITAHCRRERVNELYMCLLVCFIIFELDGHLAITVEVH
jgi:hypothetical protein